MEGSGRLAFVALVIGHWWLYVDAAVDMYVAKGDSWSVDNVSLTSVWLVQYRRRACSNLAASTVKAQSAGLAVPASTTAIERCNLIYCGGNGNHAGNQCPLTSSPNIAAGKSTAGQ